MAENITSVTSAKRKTPSRPLHEPRTAQNITQVSLCICALCWAPQRRAFASGDAALRGRAAWQAHPGEGTSRRRLARRVRPARRSGKVLLSLALQRGTPSPNTASTNPGGGRAAAARKMASSPGAFIKGARVAVRRRCSAHGTLFPCRACVRHGLAPGARDPAHPALAVHSRDALHARSRIAPRLCCGRLTPALLRCSSSMLLLLEGPWSPEVRSRALRPPRTRASAAYARLCRLRGGARGARRALALLRASPGTTGAKRAQGGLASSHSRLFPVELLLTRVAARSPTHCGRRTHYCGSSSPSTARVTGPSLHTASAAAVASRAVCGGATS